IVWSPAANSSRYLPPVRTSMSHDTSDTPVADFGTHQRWNSDGSLHAVNTMCGGASNRRVTANSRSELRSTLVGLAPAALLTCWSIRFLLFHFLDDRVERGEAPFEKLALRVDPFGFRPESPLPEPASSNPSHLFGCDQPGALQPLHLLPHARSRHVELIGKGGDGGVRPAELGEHAAAGRVRQGG